MSWTNRIVNKPAQGPDELRTPRHAQADLKLVGPDHGKAPRREILRGLVDKGVMSPNEARENWNGPR